MEVSGPLVAALLAWGSGLPALVAHRRGYRPRLPFFLAHCWMTYTCAFIYALAGRVLSPMIGTVLGAAAAGALLPVLAMIYRRSCPVTPGSGAAGEVTTSGRAWMRSSAASTTRGSNCVPRPAMSSDRTNIGASAGR